eukprot:5893990-Prorocentrum_lima.AAC.1
MGCKLFLPCLRRLPWKSPYIGVVVARFLCLLPILVADDAEESLQRPIIAKKRDLAHVGQKQLQLAHPRANKAMSF